MKVRHALQSTVRLAPLRGHRTYLAGLLVMLAGAWLGGLAVLGRDPYSGIVAVLLIAHGLRIIGERGRPGPPPPGVRLALLALAIGLGGCTFRVDGPALSLNTIVQPCPAPTPSF